MNISVSPNNPVPLYQQIVDQIKAKILSGELQPGGSLPSMRQLAEELLASVITTKRAYSELEREGLIITRPGLGAFVADLSGDTVERVKTELVAGHLRAAVKSSRELGIADDQVIRMLREMLRGSFGGRRDE